MSRQDHRARYGIPGEMCEQAETRKTSDFVIRRYLISVESIWTEGLRATLQKSITWPRHPQMIHLLKGFLHPPTFFGFRCWTANVIDAYRTGVSKRWLRWYSDKQCERETRNLVFWSFIENVQGRGLIKTCIAIQWQGFRSPECLLDFFSLLHHSFNWIWISYLSIFHCTLKLNITKWDAGI